MGVAPAPIGIQIGDFVLAHVEGRGGRIIRALQSLNGDGFADFEHAALYVGGGSMIEMAGGGIQRVGADKYDNIPTRWSTGHLTLPGIQRLDIANNAKRYLAMKIRYGWEDYAALALHHFGLNTTVLRQGMASTHHMICSQFVDQCYADAGVHLFRDNRWPGYVTPGDLSQLLDDFQDDEA